MKIQQLLCAFLLVPLWAQGQTNWTLKQCIEYGLGNYGTVKVARYQRELADQQARQALASYLPQVNGVGTIDDNIKLQSTLIPAGFISPEPKRLALGSKYTTSVSASADQVIFDKSLLMGIKANEPNKLKAEQGEQQTREKIIYNVANAYYQVFVAQEQIRLLKDNMARTAQVLEILKLQRDNGVIQPVDHDRTQVSYNNTQSQLTVAENTYNLALNKLKFQMGMAQEQPLVLSDTLLRVGAPVPAAATFDARNLIDYKIQETNLELQRIDQKRIQAGYLPRVSINARYGTMALGNDYWQSVSLFTGFGGFQLKVQLPIFDGFSRSAQIQQSKLNIRTLEEQQRINAASYQLQYNNALSQMEKTRGSLANDDRNVQLARQVYEVTTLQYKQGTKPLTDLINAENSYREAQANYINSLIGFYQAQLDREQSQGSLQNFYQQLQ